MTKAKVTTTREDRASVILILGSVVELAESPGTFVTVDPSGSRKGHLTTLETCTCKDFQFRGTVCKHRIAVRRALGGA